MIDYAAIALCGSTFGHVIEYGLIAKRATRLYRAR